MNLPSIFKNPNSIKGINSGSQQSLMTPQQDMFGLGIQVTKIQSKKEPPKPNGKKNSSMQQIRQQARQAQKTSLMTEKRSTQKMQRKLPTPLSKINSSKSKRSQYEQSRTDTFQSKKKIDRTLSSSKKLQSIKQFNPIKKPNVPSKITNNLNKSADIKKQPQKTVPPKKQITLKSKCWIDELNTLPQFYCQYQQFEQNELTKIGRKRNIEFLQQNNCQHFIDAYVSNFPKFYTQQIQPDVDHFQIENYNPNTGFQIPQYNQPKEK